MDTQMPQPIRVGYSCYAEPAYHFPSLGINCQQLFTYGANKRADADIRSYPKLHCPGDDLGIVPTGWTLANPNHGLLSYTR